MIFLSTYIYIVMDGWLCVWLWADECVCVRNLYIVFSQPILTVYDLFIEATFSNRVLHDGTGKTEWASKKQEKNSTRSILGNAPFPKMYMRTAKSVSARMAIVATKMHSWAIYFTRAFHFAMHNAYSTSGKSLFTINLSSWFSSHAPQQVCENVCGCSGHFGRDQF